MMDTKKNTSSDIELRSEKFRNLLGEIPPSLVRWGNGDNRCYIPYIVISCLFYALPSFARRKHFSAYINVIETMKNI